MTPPAWASTNARAHLDLEVYSDAWELEQIARAQYLEDCAEEASEQHSDEAAFERLGQLEQERDATLERFERAAEPYFRVRPLKRPRRARQGEAA